jgi:hypothetical protein
LFETRELMLRIVNIEKNDARKIQQARKVAPMLQASFMVSSC